MYTRPIIPIFLSDVGFILTMDEQSSYYKIYGVKPYVIENVVFMILSVFIGERRIFWGSSAPSAALATSVC